MEKNFWEFKKLEEMDFAEWEALCDCCGKCCLVKLEDEDTGEVHYTSVGCRLLNPSDCRCKNYDIRFSLVEGCNKLDPSKIKSFSFLPKSCAYRKISEGRTLDSWHPLISGDPNSVHSSGNSVANKFLLEEEVDEDDLQDFAIEMD